MTEERAQQGQNASRLSYIATRAWFFLKSVLKKDLHRGYLELGTWSIGGNPMKLQKLWHSTGPIKWPTMEQEKQLYTCRLYVANGS